MFVHVTTLELLWKLIVGHPVAPGLDQGEATNNNAEQDKVTDDEGDGKGSHDEEHPEPEQSDSDNSSRQSDSLFEPSDSQLYSRSSNDYDSDDIIGVGSNTEENPSKNRNSSEQENLGNNEPLLPQSEDQMQREYADDGRRRFHMKKPLRYYATAAPLMAPLEVEEGSAKNGSGKKKRKRRKKGKEEVKVCKARGYNMPRLASQPTARSKIRVVGDGEFVANPLCSKIVMTARVCVLEHLPSPL